MAIYGKMKRERKHKTKLKVNSVTAEQTKVYRQEKSGPPGNISRTPCKTLLQNRILLGGFSAWQKPRQPQSGKQTPGCYALTHAQPSVRTQKGGKKKISACKNYFCLAALWIEEQSGKADGFRHCTRTFLTSMEHMLLSIQYHEILMFTIHSITQRLPESKEGTEVEPESMRQPPSEPLPRLNSMYKTDECTGGCKINTVF